MGIIQFDSSSNDRDIILGRQRGTVDTIAGHAPPSAEAIYSQVVMSRRIRLMLII